jgi:hypothetical protein
MTGPRYQWRFWQFGCGRKARWGRWHDCTRQEYESTANNTGTQKRIL